MMTLIINNNSDNNNYDNYYHPKQLMTGRKDEKINLLLNNENKKS